MERDDKRPAWRLEGEDPDYRFSLANERTFLAWVRTALALIAGSLAVVAFLPAFDEPWVRRVLAVVVATAAIALSLASYVHWRNNEVAMRRREPLPYSRLPIVVSGLLVVAAVVALVLILLR